MSFDINKESIKLIQVINDDTFDYLKYVEENGITNIRKPHIRFLWIVLILTNKYPLVELYLKNLLNYFTVDELEKRFNEWSVLHEMVCYPYKISVNAFEIIIDHGINVNATNDNGNTSAHILMYEEHNSHTNSILNSLIKYGADLNIINDFGRTVLDLVIYYEKNLNEETKNYIMILVDFGATTCKPIKNMIYDFIKHYKNSTIKPAIKK